MVLQNGQGQAAVLNQDNSQNIGTNPAARKALGVAAKAASG
jgi:hypothetical protein